MTHYTALVANTNATVLTIIIKRFILVIFLCTHGGSVHQVLHILRLQIFDQNTAMTSCGLQALMSDKTILAKKGLANKAVASRRVVFFTTAASLSLFAAIFQSEEIYQSVEMKRWGKAAKRVSFRDLKASLTNWTFDRRFKLSLCISCAFVDTPQTERV